MLPLCFRFRAFPLPFRFLSSPSSPPPATRPLFLPFRFLPVSASQWLNRCSAPAHASSVFPVLPGPVSRAFVSGSRTRLPVRFLSSFPVSLPQLLTPVLPFFSASLRPLLFRAFPSLPLPFVRFPLGSDYSAFCLFFSLLPDLPWQRFSRCSPVSCVPFAFLFRPACFHAFLPIPVLSFLHFLSPFAVSPHSGYLSSWPPVSSSAIPLCFRFRFWLLSLSVSNFLVRLRPRIYYHRGPILSTLIFCLFQLLSCVL